MPKIKIKKLTRDDFRVYGSYADLLNPDGYCFGEEPVLFYRDLLQQNLGSSTSASFSICTVYEDLTIMVRIP